MRKPLTIILIFILAAAFVACGSSDDMSSNEYGTTTVTISLGAPSGINAASYGANAIPSGVTQIRFTISAADMETITHTATIEAGQVNVSESFEIENGEDRTFLVEALDATGKVLYTGFDTVNLNGTAVELSITLQNLLITLTAGAASHYQIDLSWTAIADTVSTAGYNIYRAGIRVGSVSSDTLSMSDSTGLSPDTQYCYTVSAYDASGNEFGNCPEACATTGALDITGFWELEFRILGILVPPIDYENPATIELIQSGTTITGSLMECISGSLVSTHTLSGDLTAVANGTDIAFSYTDDNDTPLDTGDDDDFALTGSIYGDIMSGDWTLTEAGGTTTTGTWRATLLQAAPTCP
jgi:hypothetical protein